MPIEINGYSRLPVEGAGDNSNVKPKRDESNVTRIVPEQRSSDSDSVSLTDAAAQLRDLEQSVSSLPEVDNQRTEKIREAVASGSYQVNPQRVADKLASFETALTGKIQK
jgi:negative regulator of flagellin synthesis FlgM